METTGIYVCDIHLEEIVTFLGISETGGPNMPLQRLLKESQERDSCSTPYENYRKYGVSEVI